MANARGSIVRENAMMPHEESDQVLADYRERLFGFQLSMAMARKMLTEHLITPQEYADIDTILTKKHGISSSSIFR